MFKQSLITSNQLLSTALTVCLALMSFSAQSAQTVSLQDGSQLELKGIGKATEFRTEIYIGILYAPVGLDSIELIKEFNTPKRLTVRYLADNYSYRKVSRHFKERIALNNPREVWQPMTPEIVTFSRIFKENFIVGDEIKIDFIPGKGTLIFLNDVLFETIENPAFINLIINAWTGSVPPSKSFKDGITGSLSDSEEQTLIAEFNAMTPVAGRFKLEATEQVATAPPVKEQPKPQPKPEVKKEVTKKAEPEKKETTPPKKQVAETKQPPKKTTPEPVKIPVKEVVEKPKPKPQPVEEDFIDEDLIRGSYTRDLIDAVRANLEYPRKAYKDGDEGDALAVVTINAAGEVEDIRLEERTGSRELDKAVVKMIRRTAPFPNVPKELKVETFTFEVPVSFEL
ncbi:TonB family protein [Pleionea litopenaei]|uniref:TonB family protein n=1 Tax=Pleionea litopenaei TaxID=3070815 RepID=A0AA51RTQ6_9GAMM|nr:TonB family protein [Pleionea sp. HL-JVS1]WMS87447.1 TonB family protein [Pleionea sp. HL-JVS1]